MQYRNTLSRALALLLAICLTGCGLMGIGSKPTRVTANVVTTLDVNQDENGRPSPIVLRIYELKAKSSFEGADFFSLYDQAEAALGPDLLEVKELVMNPGNIRLIEREADPDAQYFGVVGAYRDLNAVTWRAIHPLKQGKKNKLLIQLGSKAITITEQ